MDRTTIMRRALVFGGLFNLAAAVPVALPHTVGTLLGLRPPGTLFHAWVLAFFIAVFGLVYLWLARRPRIDLPLVVVAAIGKLGIFVISAACWMLGDISGRAMVPAVGDLAFALVFLWWAAGEQRARSAA